MKGFSCQLVMDEAHFGEGADPALAIAARRARARHEILADRIARQGDQFLVDRSDIFPQPVEISAVIGVKSGAVDGFYRIGEAARQNGRSNGGHLITLLAPLGRLDPIAQRAKPTSLEIFEAA